MHGHGLREPFQERFELRTEKHPFPIGRQARECFLTFFLRKLNHACSQGLRSTVLADHPIGARARPIQHPGFEEERDEVGAVSNDRPPAICNKLIMNEERKSSHTRRCPTWRNLVDRVLPVEEPIGVAKSAKAPKMEHGRRMGAVCGRHQDEIANLELLSRRLRTRREHYAGKDWCPLDMRTVRSQAPRQKLGDFLQTWFPPELIVEAGHQFGDSSRG